MDPTSGRGLLVIVPTYDERDHVAQVSARVLSALPEAELLFVDDASPDGTGRLLDALCADNPRIHVLHRASKLGLGTAYVAGFAWALARDYAAVAEMDADLSHDARDLPRMLRELALGADLVVGSRNVPGGGILGWGPGRHLLSKGGSRYAGFFLGDAIADWTSGFKLFRRSALLAIEPATLRSNGYAFQIETTCRALRRGLAVREIPILFVDRRVGRSKMSRRIFAEAILRVLELRFRGP